MSCPIGVGFNSCHAVMMDLESCGGSLPRANIILSHTAEVKLSRRHRHIIKAGTGNSPSRTMDDSYSRVAFFQGEAFHPGPFLATRCRRCRQEKNAALRNTKNT